MHGPAICPGAPQPRPLSSSQAPEVRSYELRGLKKEKSTSRQRNIRLATTILVQFFLYHGSGIADVLRLLDVFFLEVNWDSMQVDAIPAMDDHPFDTMYEIPRGMKLPSISASDPFVKVVKSLSSYFIDEVNTPSTFEQLRTTSAGDKIRVLVDHLVLTVTNPAIINALLTLKWHFSSLEADGRGLNETRANACEIVAWRFLYRVSERDAVDYCLYELPRPDVVDRVRLDECHNGHEPTEATTLLPQFRDRDPSSPVRPKSKRAMLKRSVSNMGPALIPEASSEDDEQDPTSSFTGLNGLEIAAVADCKKFLSQRIVQKIVTGIWRGEITFWESLNQTTQKKPQFYNKRHHSDYFARLRVPRYVKAFEVLFFATFLFLYYAVLVERNPLSVTALEVLLDIWFLAFAYDELGEFIDAGSIFYAVDIWNGCDMIIVLIGIAFMATRAIGIFKDSPVIIDWAFDILSLEALFMVPRICSLLSLHPYFGTLIPCLKEMAKDFVKFMVVVAVLYIGFLTTFTLLARDTFSLSRMSWILIKVFFGSSYLGFDIMNDINPTLGPPLMLIFVCMTNILLVTSLISILSDSFSKVIAHAREEYLFVYSIYVLEAASSNRLTHFYPPLNLIPLFLIRPLRLFLPADKLRNTRIIVLKATHTPFVAVIWVFERLHHQVMGNTSPWSTDGPVYLQGQDSNITGQTPKPFMSSRAAKASSQHFAIPPNMDGAESPRPESQSQLVRGKRETTGDGKVVIKTQALEEQVKDLSKKIEELTALIMAQQRPSEAE